MPFRVGPLELVIILLIVVAVFGAGKLASLGGALGRGVKEFRNSVKTEEGEVKPEDDAAAKPGEDKKDA